MFFFSKLALDKLDIFADLNDMTSKMIFEHLVTNEAVANITCHKSFGTFGKNMIREVIHRYVFMAGKASSSIVIIIHVPWHLGFENTVAAKFTYAISFALGTMSRHFSPWTGEATLAFNRIRRTFRENMTCHLEMIGLKVTTLQGTNNGGWISIHHEIIHTKRLILG
jgi:hypothetical protein